MVLPSHPLSIHLSRALQVRYIYAVLRQHTYLCIYALYAYILPRRMLTGSHTVNVMLNEMIKLLQFSGMGMIMWIWGWDIGSRMCIYVIGSLR